MGSIDNACLTGFVCRLCSRVKPNVIHVYGEKGRQMELLKMINNTFSVKIRAKDELPKTVCETCADKTVQHYKFIENVKKKNRFISAYQKRKIPIYELLNNQQTFGQGT